MLHAKDIDTIASVDGWDEGSFHLHVISLPDKSLIQTLRRIVFSLHRVSCEPMDEYPHRSGLRQTSLVSGITGREFLLEYVYATPRLAQSYHRGVVSAKTSQLGAIFACQAVEVMRSYTLNLLQISPSYAPSSFASSIRRAHPSPGDIHVDTDDLVNFVEFQSVQFASAGLLPLLALSGSFGVVATFLLGY